MATAIRPLSHGQAAAAQSLAVDVVAAEVLTRLRHADVRALVLKGPSFARWLYEDTGLRTYNDLDLLVAPDDVVGAGRVLAWLGFRGPLAETEVSSHHQVWMRAGVVVELHDTFHGIGAAPHRFWADLSQATETAVVLGTTVEVPAAPARCLLVALHAAAHQDDFVWPLHDLERAVHAVPESAWSQAAALAERVDAHSAFAFGLTRVAAGAQLAGRLGLTAPPPWTVPWALRAARAPDGSHKLERLARSGGVRPALALALRTIVPTREYMSLLHGPGRARLLRAYLARPFIIARRTAPAWIAWRRARRSLSR